MTESAKHAIGVTIVVIIGALFVSAIVLLTAVVPWFWILVVGFAIPLLLLLGIHLAGWDEEDY